MKKFGFTLMELLSTLAIIGLVATLVAPALTNIMPDKTKMQVIKLHKALAETTAEMLEDPDLYQPGKFEIVNGEEIACPGLTDFQMYWQERIRREEGRYYANGKENDKYPNTLAEFKFETVKSYTDEFITRDGVWWKFETSGRKLNNTTKSYEITYTVTVDLNGEYKAPNEIASKTVKNPDRFTFLVDTYGNVTGGDPLTIQYLKTRTKFNNKKEDYKAAFGS